MKNRIESDVEGKALRLLRGAPGAAKEPIDIGSEHSRRVIKTEEGIMPPAFINPAESKLI